MGTWNPFDPDYKWTGFNLRFVDDIPGVSAINAVTKWAPLAALAILLYLVVRR